jgi:4a-hydroxytetrahydrobiopterin dehydratase
MGTGYVDLKLLSDDAVYRDDAGTEHQVEWVTQQDVDLARRISEIAAEQSLSADPRSITPSSWRSTPRTPLPWHRCGRPC